MKTRAVILAGGEGSRLGILTAKRTKPAVPFAGKYRIIDFTLSNCVNSNIFDVMILAQYRPHSLIEHIGAGGPWDLNRDFTGGVRILTPYKARGSSNWYVGTANAVQQNFSFIKRGAPDHILILSGDHIYKSNYDAMIAFHRDHAADVTIASIRVPIEEASRFGILEVGDNYRITNFIEKPPQPQSNLVNMGVYLFNTDILNSILWEDAQRIESSHDFGKDILPKLVSERKRVFAYPFTGYWVDVGTVHSYWQSHMDILTKPEIIGLNDRSWIIHTRTEERPPVWIANNAILNDSMISDGCIIGPGAIIEKSVLGPGVIVKPNARITESIIFTDTIIHSEAKIERTITDKRVIISKNAIVGKKQPEFGLVMIGKNSLVPDGYLVEPGAVIATDVTETDYPSNIVNKDQYIQTKRMPYEI